MTLTQFHQAHARAARRALATGNADAYMNRYATDLVRKGYDLDLLNRYTLVMEPLLKEHCIAKTEDLAITEVMGNDLEPKG